MKLTGNNIKNWEKFKKKFKAESDEEAVIHLLQVNVTREKEFEEMHILHEGIQKAGQKEIDTLNDKIENLESYQITLQKQILEYQSVFETIELARLKTDTAIANITLARKTQTR